MLGLTLNNHTNILEKLKKSANMVYALAQEVTESGEIEIKVYTRKLLFAKATFLYDLYKILCKIPSEYFKE